MKKSELKQCLQVYVDIEKELKGHNTTSVTRCNRRKRQIVIKPWMYKLPEFLILIEDSENHIIRQIIKQSIKRGEKDKKVLCSIPVSESTYYRWKRQIVDKIYELYILSNDVTEEEILSERIE